MRYERRPRGPKAYLRRWRRSWRIALPSQPRWTFSAHRTRRPLYPLRSTLMNWESIQQSLLFWSTVLGTVLAFFGVLQSLNWLVTVGGLVLAASIVTFIYARHERSVLQSAIVKIDGRSIDSLNLATLRRRPNRSLVLQRAENTATIDRENLAITWQCDGYCRSNEESVIRFSVDADNNIPYEELRCYAYDLHNDPERRHRIRPLLVGPDGISKKVAVPFLSRLKAQQPFSVLLHCELPGCMKSGVDYYTTTFAFDQDRVGRYTMRLTFLHAKPAWVRVYDCDSSGRIKLVKELRPVHEQEDRVEYVDSDENVAANSARVYVFFRHAAAPSPAVVERTQTVG